MQEGALLRLVYITAYSSISFFLPFPHSPPFICSTIGLFIIITFSFSLIIPLSLCLCLLESRSSPFHLLIALFHAPFLAVIFSFLFVALSLLPSPHSPIYHKKKKGKSWGCSWIILAGRCIDETTTLAASRRHLKCSCVNRSATFAKERNSSVCLDVFINRWKFIFHPRSCFLWSRKLL